MTQHIFKAQVILLNAFKLTMHLLNLAMTFKIQKLGYLTFMSPGLI